MRMEYEIGSLADLITGTVTPNRPKLSRKAFTPVKHKLSPNVTPRGSEALVDNNSFVSPSVQKRKNIVKKSPKRIFENINGDLDSSQTENVVAFVEKTKLNLNAVINATTPKLNISNNKVEDENEILKSEKKKQKKRSIVDNLQNELNMSNKQQPSTKSETKIKDKEYESTNINNNIKESILGTAERASNDTKIKTPKNKRKSVQNSIPLEHSEIDVELNILSDKKKRKSDFIVNNSEEVLKSSTAKDPSIKTDIETPSKKNKRKSDQTITPYKKRIEVDSEKCILSDEKKGRRESISNDSLEDLKSKNTEKPESEIETPKKKNKKKKKQNTSDAVSVPVANKGGDSQLTDKTGEKKSKKEGRAAKRRARKIAALKKLGEKGIVASTKKKNSSKSNNIDNGDSSSEHESDDELESETELEVKNILNNTDHQDETSDEEDGDSKKGEKQEVGSEDKVAKKDKGSEEKEEEVEEEIKDKVEELKKPKEHVVDETEAKRTLFVGNVPYSGKCKKELKKIFSPYGAIDTIRFRTIPTKDARITPKLAVIKEEFHPDRDTVVNAYIKFRDMAHATLALAANNKKMGDFHIRVTRSEISEVSRDSRAVLFVGNLPFGCEEEQLRNAFEKCGPIESVRIVRDRKTQIGKGFGYVNFESADGVELALTLSEEELKVKNRNVRVRRYLVAGTKKKNQNGLNNRFAGPNNRSGPPNRFGEQNNRSGPPNNRFSGQNNQSGPPDRFGGPNNRSGPPNNRFGGQNNRSGPPNDRFGNKNYRFGGNESQIKPNAEIGEKQPTGAALRIQNKTQRSQGAIKRQRENAAGESASPSKRPARDTPRDKKPAKEYLGVTADKKKKKRVSKTDKRKKKLSEILVKSM